MTGGLAASPPVGYTLRVARSGGSLLRRLPQAPGAPDLLRWSTFALVSAQAPSAVILVRAERFKPNPATAADNAFQAEAPEGQSDGETADRALAEMDAVAEALRAAGVRVHVFSDEDHTRPDSVFPNNWLSTHAGGQVAVYPMYASNRRHERRADVLELLKSEYRVQTIVDYSGLEPDGIFLEGTGAMVLDHVSRVAYAARMHAVPADVEHVVHRDGRTVAHVVERQHAREPAVDDLRARRGLEEQVHRAALVGLDVGERDPAQILYRNDAVDRVGHEREHLAHPGVEQERLVAADQELVEREARGRGDFVDLGRQAEDVRGDLVDLGFHLRSP